MSHPLSEYISKYTGKNVHAKRLNHTKNSIVSLLEHHSSDDEFSHRNRILADNEGNMGDRHFRRLVDDIHSGKGETNDLAVAQTWFKLNVIRNTATQDPRFKYKGSNEAISRLQDVTIELRDHLSYQRQYELNGLPDQEEKKVLTSSLLETLEKGNALYDRLDIGSLSPEERKVAREWHFAARVSHTATTENEKDIHLRKALSDVTAELNHLVNATLYWPPSSVLSSSQERINSKKQVAKDVLSIGNYLHAQLRKEKNMSLNGVVCSWDPKQWPNIESRFKWSEASSRWESCVAALEEPSVSKYTTAARRPMPTITLEPIFED